MMKRRPILSVCFAAFFCLVPSVGAQDYEDLPKLKEIKGKKLLEEITPVQDEKRGLWGYANSEGKFTIKPVFTAACPYEGNLARISVEGKWGLINNIGTYAVYPQFEAIELFSADSLAVTRHEGKYGIIDNKGRCVAPFIYDSFTYTDYGYRFTQNGLTGTVGQDGAVLLAPQFDVVEILDRSKGLEQICVGSRWGVLRNGREILTLKFDERMVFLQHGQGHPDLYMVRQDGKIGIVTVDGRYVAPAVYDAIEYSASKEYLITTKDGKYGAITLTMEEIFPPVMDSKPYLGDELFKVCVDGGFWAANRNGAVEFADCDYLYKVFKPNEYPTTKYFPQWAKSDMIEANMAAWQERTDKARQVVAEASPQTGSAASYPESWDEKYGMMDRGVFARASGSVYCDGTICSVLYRTPGDEANSLYFLTNPQDGKYYLRIDEAGYPIDSLVARFNIKKFTGMYPRGYARLSDDKVLVSFAFLRPKSELSTPLTETNPYLLPLDPFKVNIHTGAVNSKAENHLAVIYDLEAKSCILCFELPSGTGGTLRASAFGGIYTGATASVIADASAPLRRFGKGGTPDWEFVPEAGETFYDMEETENHIYLCGAAKTFSGAETPMLVQLSKRGKRMLTKTYDHANARFTGVGCYEGVLYMKAASTKGASSSGKGYYPYVCLADIKDNVGVRLATVWEEWGAGTIGGCGLTDEDGNWLRTPVLPGDDICTDFNYKFGAFTEKWLVVRHMSQYGLLSRDGEMVVDAQYDMLAPLCNPDRFRAQLDGKYGVIAADGKVVVPFEYDSVGDMNEDIIIVSKDGKYGTFDKDGVEMAPMKFEEIKEYVGGRARVLYEGLYGFIDKYGNFLVRPFFDEVDDFCEGYARVKYGNNVTYADLSGNWIVPMMYQDGGRFSDGLAPLAQGGLYGYIDTAGGFVVPMQYSDAEDFVEGYGLACVSSDTGRGVIDRKGTVVLPLVYDDVQICADGYLYVEKNGKYGVYDSKGKELCPPVCDTIERASDGNMFKYGAVSARIDGKRVRIDESGNIIYKYSLITE